MTPREKVIAIDTYTSEKALLHIIKNCNFSRIPVYKDKMDNIVGILVVKEKKKWHLSLKSHIIKNTNKKAYKLLLNRLFILLL